MTQASKVAKMNAMAATAITTNTTLNGLTSKQIEALALVADGRTNKEIATELGISISAAVQRIESIRIKFDGASKAELGRIYREYEDGLACKEFTGNSFQVPSSQDFTAEATWDRPASSMTLSDSMTFEANPPWSTRRETRLVPEMLDGRNAVAYRWVLAVGLALGMAILSLVLLAVAAAIGDML